MFKNCLKIDLTTVTKAAAVLLTVSAPAQAADCTAAEFGTKPGCSAPVTLSVGGARMLGPSSFESFYDNPLLNGAVPLSIIMVDRDGDGVRTPEFEESLGATDSASREKFELRVMSNCDPADLLCQPVVFNDDNPSREMWPVDIGQLTAPETLAAQALGLRIGHQPATLRVIRQSAEALSTESSLSVSLDPEVLVVPLDVVVVLPHPQTQLPPEFPSDFLTRAAAEMRVVTGAEATVNGDGSISVAGAEAFAEALFDFVPANDFVRVITPGGIVLTERSSFLRQPDPLVLPDVFIDPVFQERQSEWIMPDSVWVQCGIQFRVKSVHVVLEDNPEFLFGDPNEPCAGGLTQTGRVTDLRNRWTAMAGLPQSGAQVIVPFRYVPEGCASSLGGAPVGLSDSGWSMVPVDPPVGGRSSITVYHELGHLLGLDHLPEDQFGLPQDSPENRCFGSSDGPNGISGRFSNVMCNGGEHVGLTVAGCNSWRSDGTLPPLCHPQPGDATLSPSLTCAQARAGAQNIIGGPVNKKPMVAVSHTVLACPDAQSALVRLELSVTPDPTDPIPGVDTVVWRDDNGVVLGQGFTLETSVPTALVSSVPRLNGHLNVTATDPAGFATVQSINVSDVLAYPSILQPADTDVLACEAQLDGSFDIGVPPVAEGVCSNNITTTGIAEVAGTSVPVVNGVVVLPPGQHNVTWTATDPFGRTSAAVSQAVNVVAAPPSISDAAPINLRA